MVALWCNFVFIRNIDVESVDCQKNYNRASYEMAADRGVLSRTMWNKVETGYTDYSSII